jgi:hypothetical protein
LFGRLLHDRTADKIASIVARTPNAAATIVPFEAAGTGLLAGTDRTGTDKDPAPAPRKRSSDPKRPAAADRRRADGGVRSRRRHGRA